MCVCVGGANRRSYQKLKAPVLQLNAPATELPGLKVIKLFS